MVSQVGEVSEGELIHVEVRSDTLFISRGHGMLPALVTMLAVRAALTLLKHLLQPDTGVDWGPDQR
jgi:hypothetical protein